MISGLSCTDYKAEFMLDNKRYCYPLTISDDGSLYLFCPRGPRVHQVELCVLQIHDVLAALWRNNGPCQQVICI